MAVALGAALRYTGTSRGTPMAGVGAAAHAMESNCSASPIPRAIPAGNGKEDPFVPPDADTRTTRMPHHPIGLGTYLIEKETIASTLRTAIQIGYRRIDCAPVYFNEDAIGDALAEILSTTTNSRDLGSSNNTNTNNKEQNQNTTVHQVTRSDLFVVSKLPSPFHRNVEAAVRKTLSDLRMEYLDLYLGRFSTFCCNDYACDFQIILLDSY